MGIDSIAPFPAELDGECVILAAMLPQFGGIAGMVVDPDWSVIEPHTDALLDAGYGYSAVTVGDDDESACEMLRDWGWTSTSEKPDWL